MAEDPFAAADAAHFHWTTADPGFAPVEEALLGPRLGALAFPCLEIGCGEGTNLVRLARRGRPFGIDRSLARARFAARAVPGAQLAIDSGNNAATGNVIQYVKGQLVTNSGALWELDPVEIHSSSPPPLPSLASLSPSPPGRRPRPALRTSNATSIRSARFRRASCRPSAACVVSRRAR